MFNHALTKVAWRFFTGAHMDGHRYSNATWFRHGTMPRHSITWWNSKPRAHRMVWRWIIVGVPIGWVTLYSHYHYWTVLGTIALAPYLIHRTWHEIHTRARQSVNIPRHFETRADDVNVTDLTFEVDPKQRKAQ